MTIYGDKLHELRKAKGLTLDELAEKMNNLSDYKVSRSAISRWENGKTVPSATAMSLYAKLFNVDMNNLLNVDKRGDIMTTGQNIKKYRLQRKMTLEELSKEIGVSTQAIFKYENDIVTNIPLERLELLCKVLKVKPQELISWADDTNKSSISSVKIPVLGYVAAGLPIEAIEDIIDYEEIPEEMARSGEFFGLEIHGNSMYPRIFEGDVVIVKKQSTADSGDIVIALINGEDGICKQLYKYKDHIELRSFNPMYKPLVYSNEDIDSLPVTIMGKVVELRGKF